MRVLSKCYFNNQATPKKVLFNVTFSQFLKQLEREGNIYILLTYFIVFMHVRHKYC